MGILTKLYTTINNKILFNPEKEHPSVPEQMKFLKSFPEPSSVWERAFFKYKCLIFYSYSKAQKIFINILSLFALILLIPYYRLKGWRHDKESAVPMHPKRLLRKSTKRISIADIYPEQLNRQYADIVDYEGVSYKDIFITKDAFAFFQKVLHTYPVNFHFSVVILIRLSQASYLLHQYAPQGITTYVCEREFSDPILTEYYRTKNVEYHAFMHGDYLFSLEHAFMHYTKYWVWDKHYETLFSALRCEFPTEIYTPKKYSGIVKPKESVDDYEYYATYYFSSETKKSTEIIKEALMQLKSKGKKCKVRPHPRFSDKERIDKLFGEEFLVEDTSLISIEESLDNSYMAIAMISTVLSQAYYSDKIIVIDDLSNPKFFSELKEKQYILADKADMFLSELLSTDGKKDEDCNKKTQ